MNLHKLLVRPGVVFSVSLLFGCLALTHSIQAATSTVQVLDNRFSPINVTNRPGDTVQWSWQGFNAHSSTSSGLSPLWDSGIHGNGFSFSHTFQTAGNFPYRCVVHAGQTGTVVVKAAANKPPSVAIQAPADGSAFAAPWSGNILASVSDADGTVTNVDFWANSVRLGSVRNPTTSAAWPVTNLPAGAYILLAIATDNQGATNVSTGIHLLVLSSAPVSLQEFIRASSANFSFNYTATPGLDYVVSRSTDLMAWTPIATNTATESLVNFVDNAATNGASFYSVRLLANP